MQLEEIKALIEKTSPDEFANYLRQKYPMPKKTRSIVMYPNEYLWEYSYQMNDCFLHNLAEKYFEAPLLDLINEHRCGFYRETHPIIRLSSSFLYITFTTKNIIEKADISTIYLIEELKQFNSYNLQKKRDFLKKISMSHENIIEDLI